MASIIFVHVSAFSSKTTQYGDKIMTPMAFLSDKYSGIALHEEKTEYGILTPETGYRGILAATRGAIMAQELSQVNEDLLYACYCAGMNAPDSTQARIARRIDQHIGKNIIDEIKSFVPNNIIDTLSKLAKENILFDGQEIEIEKNKGRIKKSKDLDDIILQNKVTEKQIELEEYGDELELDEFKEDMDLGLYEQAIVSPFLKEYFLHCNKNNMRIVTYITAGTRGYYILSKLKSNNAVDLDFGLELRLEYMGLVDKLKSTLYVAPSIIFTNSTLPVTLELFSEEELKDQYGSEIKFDLSHKLPFLFKKFGATINTNAGETTTHIVDKSLTNQVESIKDRIYRRRKPIELYGAEIVN